MASWLTCSSAVGLSSYLCCLFVCVCVCVSVCVCVLALTMAHNVYAVVCHVIHNNTLSLLSLLLSSHSLFISISSIGQDKHEFVVKRIHLLANVGVTNALVALSNTESKNSRELLCRVFLALATEESLRGLLVQQGAVKVSSVGFLFSYVCVCVCVCLCVLCVCVCALCVCVFMSVSCVCVCTHNFVCVISVCVCVCVCVFVCVCDCVCWLCVCVCTCK